MKESPSTSSEARSEEKDAVPISKTTLTTTQSSKATTKTTKTTTRLIESFQKEQELLQISMNTSLLLASSRGDLRAVQRLVEYCGANLWAARDSKKRSPLHRASRQGHLRVVKYLVEKGGTSALNQLDVDGLIPLVSAIRAIQLPVVQYLLLQHEQQQHYQAKPHICTATFGKRDWTLLHHACGFKFNTKIASFLLQKCHEHVDVNALGAQQQTPLLLACVKQNLNLVHLLLESGANPNLSDEEMGTPLAWAVQYNNLEIMERLLQGRANIYVRDAKGQTLLHRACNEEPFELWEGTVDILLEHGATVNATNEQQSTPVFFACQRDNLELVQRLVDAGANLHHVNTEGQDPLCIACAMGHVDIVRYLLQKEEVSSSSGLGQRQFERALIQASAAGHLDIIRLLVQHNVGTIGALAFQ